MHHTKEPDFLKTEVCVENDAGRITFVGHSGGAIKLASILRRGLDPKERYVEFARLVRAFVAAVDPTPDEGDAPGWRDAIDGEEHALAAGDLARINSIRAEWPLTKDVVYLLGLLETFMTNADRQTVGFKAR